MRSTIGAALQEAALDPLLTGRDHLRLQTMLQGLPRAGPASHTELLERVWAAGGRPQGGGLLGRHEAKARPRARARPPASRLFLDEPTTGLDPQSRTALWDEVARLRATTA